MYKIVSNSSHREKLLAGAASATLASFFLFSGEAAAQGDGEENSEARKRDVIVVTAQKREQSLQDVPLSVTAFGEDVIQDANIAEARDIVLLTPGLELAESIGRQTGSFSIRGVAPFGFADPTVLVFVDGFTLGFTRTHNNAQLFDLERIEVLKGPQATLYGRNALGGVINYITKKPGDEFEGYLKGEAGSHDSYDIAGSVSGPLVPGKLFAAAGVGYREFGGFLDNEFDGAEDVNGEKDFLARGHLRFLPTDDFEMNFTFNYAESDDECGDCAHVPEDFGFSFIPDDFLAIGRGEIDFNDISRTVNQDFLGGFERDEQTYVLNIDYDLGWAELTSITGYAKLDADLELDVNREPFPIPGFASGIKVLSKRDGWSEELRLASSGDQRLTWLVGAYIFNSDSRAQTVFGGPDFDTSGFPTSLVEIENYAGFFNADYRISDAFSVGFGLRYDYEENTFNQLTTGNVFSTDADAWLPKFTASFFPNEDTHIYATVSRGYHAGGNNTNAAAPQTEFGPEFLWNYELGVKGQVADSRINYELAGFYQEWNAQQVQSTIDGVNGFITNAGESRIYGFEAGLNAELADGFTLTGALTVLDAKYEMFEDPFTAPLIGFDSDLAGNDLPFSPNVAASFSAQYVTPLSGDWDIRLRADGRYTGERAIEFVNAFFADAYFIANLYAGVENDHFELGVFADNVFDEGYILGGFVPGQFFPPLMTIGDPRIWGVRGRISF